MKRFILCTSKVDEAGKQGWLPVHEFEDGCIYVFCRSFKSSEQAIKHARGMAIKALAGCFVEVEAVGDYIKYNY